MTYMEGFASSIGNLFACIKIKEVLAFVISWLSIFFFSPSDGGDFSMIPTILGWLLYSTTTIEDNDLMICTILYPSMSPIFGGVLKASKTFVSDIKINVGDGCSTRFFLDHWVGDTTLVSLFPDLYLLAMNPSTTVNTQTRLFEGRMI